MCETMCESYPPQCCGESIDLTGLGNADLESILPPRTDTQRGAISLRWSDTAVTCTGSVSNDSLQVTSINGQPLAATPTLGRTCSSDSDCGDGQTCELIPDCDMCDGGSMECVKGESAAQ